MALSASQRGPLSRLSSKVSIRAAGVDVISPRKCTEEEGGLSQGCMEVAVGDLPDEIQTTKSLRNKRSDPKARGTLHRDLGVLGRKL